MGLVAMTRRASICSVTFIVLISAVMADPTRPAQTTPTSTGPSSRPMAMAMTPPIVDCAPKRMNSCATCSVMTMPVKSIVKETMANESTPRCDICAKMCRKRKGRRISLTAAARSKTTEPTHSNLSSTNEPIFSNSRIIISYPLPQSAMKYGSHCL